MCFSTNIPQKVIIHQSDLVKAIFTNLAFHSLARVSLNTAKCVALKKGTKLYTL